MGLKLCATDRVFDYINKNIEHQPYPLKTFCMSMKFGLVGFEPGNTGLDYEDLIIRLFPSNNRRVASSNLWKQLFSLSAFTLIQKS